MNIKVTHMSEDSEYSDETPRLSARGIISLMRNNKAGIVAVAPSGDISDDSLDVSVWNTTSDEDPKLEITTLAALTHRLFKSYAKMKGLDFNKLVGEFCACEMVNRETMLHFIDSLSSINELAAFLNAVDHINAVRKHMADTERDESEGDSHGKGTA